MTNAYKLAHKAISVAKRQQAISTARACGDWEYWESNLEELQRQQEELEQLKASSTEAEIQAARQITNAQI